MRVRVEPAPEAGEVLERAARGGKSLPVVDVERAADPLLRAVSAEERERLRRGGGEPDADFAPGLRRDLRPVQHEVLLHARQCGDPDGERRRGPARGKRGDEDLAELLLELGCAQGRGRHG